jgi:hypothetical protein
MSARNFTKGPLKYRPIWYDGDILKACVLGVGLGFVLSIILFSSFLTTANCVVNSVTRF